LIPGEENEMNMSAFDAYGLAVILVLGVMTPLMGIRDFRRLMRWIKEGRPGARLYMYNVTIGSQWILTVALTGLWLATGRDSRDLGLLPTATGWQWLAIGLGLALTSYMVLQMLYLLRHPDKLCRLKGKMGDVALLAPQTDEEVRRYHVASVTAGVCEEILYRGILFAILAVALGDWAAVVLSSLIFGLGHAYQGVAGIGKTTLVGFVMASLLVFTGSLFVPILLHTVIDLTSGRLISASSRLEQASNSGITRMSSWK
jgi:membrane protease YdiL (CAAX protease family)